MSLLDNSTALDLTWSTAAYNFAARSVWALIATTMVLMAISAAPAAGESSIPIGARMPAASGSATILYPVAHQRFCTILR